jgi:hypothetical protein
MKKILLVPLLIAFASSASYSNYSILNCSAQKGTTIQVYLNGKLINKKPNNVVQLKSSGGCNSIFIIILNELEGSPFSVQRDIDIESGYEMYFTIISDGCGSYISTSRRYPLLNSYSYSKKLYARRYIS